MLKCIIKFFLVNCAFIALVVSADDNALVKGQNKLLDNECQYQLINKNTKELYKVAVYPCDFSQSKEDLERGHIAIIKVNKPLTPGKCVFDEMGGSGALKSLVVRNCNQTNDTCEEITDTYVICRGLRYELAKGINNSLTRDITKIQDKAELGAIKTGDASSK
ncbi:MAG: hypothetical protein Q7U04_12060 [Bacteriovorax sp.]|nr:hypothetical protein [Bacteriovorax sp.]